MQDSFLGGGGCGSFGNKDIRDFQEQGVVIKAFLSFGLLSLFLCIDAGCGDLLHQTCSRDHIAMRTWEIIPLTVEVNGWLPLLLGPWVVASPSPASPQTTAEISRRSPFRSGDRQETIVMNCWSFTTQTLIIGIFPDHYFFSEKLGTIRTIPSNSSSPETPVAWFFRTLPPKKNHRISPVIFAEICRLPWCQATWPQGFDVSGEVLGSNGGESAFPEYERLKAAGIRPGSSHSFKYRAVGDQF
jgi:hypothetical protein